MPSNRHEDNEITIQPDSLVSNDSYLNTMVGGDNYEDPRDEKGWVPLSPLDTDNDHVLLTVWREKQDQVVLKFTVEFVETLAYKPVKWLAYAAWCLHGYDGAIVDNKGEDVGLDQGLVRGMHYYFKPSTHSPSENSRTFKISNTFVCQKVLAFRDAATSATSATSRTSDPQAHTFSSDVKKRDGGCIFTARPLDMCHAAYLIPKQTADVSGV
jgi:hypothetical protein